MNTSKIHLYVKLLLLKTNWRLGRKIFYSQNCKKEPHKLGREGREAIRLGHVSLGGALRKRGLSQVQRSSLRTEGFKS